MVERQFLLQERQTKVVEHRRY